MPTSRFEPSLIKNKIKREEVVRKSKKAKSQLKLQRRLALAKQEANDPSAKKVKFSPLLFLIFSFQYLSRNVLRKTFLAPLTIPENLTRLS
jgi:hypothetical protein